MKTEMEQFLNLRALPGRLSKDQAAWLLGFTSDEVTILIAKGLLKPLGNPAPNGQKFFHTAALMELLRDEKWFVKASNAVTEYWRNKNFRKGQGFSTNGNQGGIQHELAE